MKEYLTETEIGKIEAFCKDEAMLQAVEKVLLAGIYAQGTVPKDGASYDPTFNGALTLVAQSSTYPISDELLGQNLRAKWEGINALKNAFGELKAIKKEVKEVETPYTEHV